jgi:NAD(P)-dependent dehydrogenase (short-subunit alcohol dehydrogenase family)
MKDFAGRIAVVTGGGSGMGRELVRQLVAEACNVAMCDAFEEGMAETRRLCEAAGLPQGLRVTTHLADVSDEAQVESFCDEVAERHATDKVHLLFNNAGIGGGSMFAHSRAEWEKDVQYLLGRRLQLHPRFPADAAEGGGRPHHQYQQRQRLLGVGRAAHSAHGLFGGEIRGERLYRGADHRSQDQRAAHQMLGRHARPYRHLDPAQLAQDPKRQPVRRDRRKADRASAGPASPRWAAT